MSTAILEPSISDYGSNVSTLERLEQEMAALRHEVSELRCEVGYWKSRHADAVARNERLSAELVEARGEIRVLQDKLFGRKSEKFRRGDRSNDLVDPERAAAEAKKRGAQPGQASAARLFPSAGSRRVHFVVGGIAGLPGLRQDVCAGAS
jgi:chromosome segregation ATPase